MEDLFDAASRFVSQGRIAEVRPYGSGNVHDTFLVTLDSGSDNHFVLQRINTRVFRRPELIMENMRVLAEHVRGRLLHTPPSSGRRWEVPSPLSTRDGRDCWTDPKGALWRAITFIDAAQTFDTITSAEHAREVGHALGMFHSLISDLPAHRLSDTLEGFHITPGYLLHFDQVLTKHETADSPEMKHCLRFVEGRRAFATVLEDARARGKLGLRPIHGDPKVNNVMIDTATGLSVGMVDLDTVKPGLIHYDIGDCLRSCCNPLGEETALWEAVRFEPDLCHTILEGYLGQAGSFLTEDDYEFLYDAIRLIAFELGLRFFTDHLEGDVYFKVRHREHNLARALVQFRLTESIESQAAALRNIIRGMR